MGFDTDEIDLVCGDCGASIGEVDRSYPFGTDSVLCEACALRRGGVYDEQEDRWITHPFVDDLMERLERPRP
jgi:hypothetical protein